MRVVGNFPRRLVSHGTMPHVSRRLAAPLLSLVVAACGAPPARAPSATNARPLPLRTLRLYETGVGYFERSGKIGGAALHSLPVPAGHLDDALESLVVLSAGGGGQITGVSFASSVTRATARARAGLPPDGTQPIRFEDLLVSMKGEHVSVAPRGRDLARGRVVEVTEEATDPAKPDVKHLVVTLLSDAGEVMVLDAQDILRIRPEGGGFAQRLDAAIDATSPRSAQNERPLTLLGDARGEVTFGYIAETPIWRSTYRLVLDPGGHAHLQGWALVHNDTDERWQGVHLELVNGEPDSFLFPLAAPRYAKRELLHPDTPLSTLPQLQATTADALWGDNVDTELTGVSGSGFGYGGGGMGRASVSRAATPSLRVGSSSSDVGRSSLLSVGNLAALAPARGVENGALFVYAVPAAFELDGHTSALVPFLDKAVATESIAFCGAPGEPARAAVRFVNDTGQTLPAGTIAVFGEGGFSGESTLDRLKPGERRFLQFGNDLDAEVTAERGDRKEEAKRLTFEGDQLQEHFLATTEHTWRLENRSGSARTFYVGLSAVANASVTGTDRVDFDATSSQPVVVFDAPPRSKAPRTFTVVEGLSRTFSIDGLTAKVVRELLQKTSIPGAELAILAHAEAPVRALEQEIAKAREAERATTTAEQDLERFREHLKALSGPEKASAAGVTTAALVKRILDLEDKLEAARKVRSASDDELAKRREAVRTVLARLRRR